MKKKCTSFRTLFILSLLLVFHLMGGHQINASQQRQIIKPPRTLGPTIQSASPARIKLRPGGQEVEVTFNGQNLQLIKGYSIIQSGRVIAQQEIKASLAGNPTSTSAKILFKASSQAKAGANYQVRVMFDSKTLDIPLTQFSIEVNQMTIGIPIAPRIPGAGTITVKAPNGGEVWDPEDILLKTIKWDSTGDSGSTVKIELFKGNVKALDVAQSASNSGQYPWNPPDNLSYGSNYRIKITSNGNTDISDMSDNNFTLGKSIDVISPKAGDVWGQKGTYTIKWYKNSDAGPSVKIDLFVGNTLKIPITSNTSNSGAFDWKTGDTEIGSSYRIKITDLHKPLLGDPPQDMSDDFSIVDSTIKMISPKEGDQVNPTSPCSISWTSDINLYPKVTILLKDGPAIASQIANSNKFGWNISTSQVQEPGKYYLTVKGTTATSPTINERVGKSGQFLIALPIEISAPKSGDVWFVGQLIEVLGKGIGTVEIELWKGDQKSMSYGPQKIAFPNGGHIGSYPIPDNSPEGDDYRFKVYYRNGVLDPVFSQYFSVKKR
jgi:hypothetical protein